MNRNLIVTELYSKYSTRLLNEVYKAVGNYHDAEDIVSDTFLKIMNNKHISLPDLKTVVSVCNERLRCYFKNFKDSNDYNKLFSIYKDPLEIILEEENYEILENHILNSKRTYSSVLVLYYIDKMRACDIGRLLSIKENTAIRKIHRGKALLRESLIKKGYKQ